MDGAAESSGGKIGTAVIEQQQKRSEKTGKIQDQVADHYENSRQCIIHEWFWEEKNIV